MGSTISFEEAANDPEKLHQLDQEIHDFHASASKTMDQLNQKMLQHFGQRLKQERELLHYSAAGLADILNVSTTCVLKWEKGKNLPTAQYLLAMCQDFLLVPYPKYEQYYCESKKQQIVRRQKRLDKYELWKTSHKNHESFLIKMFNCSIDYLLCLTDQKNISEPLDEGRLWITPQNSAFLKKYANDRKQFLSSSILGDSLSTDTSFLAKTCINAFMDSFVFLGEDLADLCYMQAKQNFFSECLKSWKKNFPEDNFDEAKLMKKKWERKLLYFSSALKNELFESIFSAMKKEIDEYTKRIRQNIIDDRFGDPHDYAGIVEELMLLPEEVSSFYYRYSYKRRASDGKSEEKLLKFLGLNTSETDPPNSEDGKEE